jgi:dihydroflavonol-4-reductase
MMTRTLVTGGSGFIGQYLVSELATRGRQVRVLDVRRPGRALPGVEFVEGSVLDEERVGAAVANVDEIYHLAGLPGMWKLNKQEFHDVNFIGTRHVLAAAQKLSNVKFLHCSTESILFHSPSDQPSDEEASLCLDDMPGPYTRSKMLADELALQVAESGFPVIVGCPTMPIGPHDHNVTPPTAMLQHFLGGGPLQMYLDFKVNFVDVRDVATGLILAMEKGRVGHRYLLGGSSISLKRVLELMMRVSGRRKLLVSVPGGIAELAARMIEWKSDALTHREPSATVEGVRIARRATSLSVDKARRELGYVPRPIEPLLREMIAHMSGVSVSKVLKHA